MMVDSPKENLYEIPRCTICLEQMKGNLVVLSCGHCFHHCCVKQHLERKSFCPNCRKISDCGDMRSVFYDLTRKGALDKQQNFEDGKLKEEVRKMKMTIESYAQSAQFCSQMLTTEQQENAYLKERLSEIIDALQEVGFDSHKNKFRFNNFVEANRVKETILAQEVKALRALLKFKKAKPIPRFRRNVSGTKAEDEQNQTLQSSLNITSDFKFKQKDLKRVRSYQLIH